MDNEWSSDPLMRAFMVLHSKFPELARVRDRVTELIEDADNEHAALLAKVAKLEAKIAELTTTKGWDNSIPPLDNAIPVYVTRDRDTGMMVYVGPPLDEDGPSVEKGLSYLRTFLAWDSEEFPNGGGLDSNEWYHPGQGESE